MPYPPLAIAVIVGIVILFTIVVLAPLARLPMSARRFHADRDGKYLVNIEDVTFENRVIATLQTQTGCWGRPNERDLIEVYKDGKLVGIVKCCEDGSAVTPPLVAEMAKLKVWYHVKIAYIAVGSQVSSIARTEAKKLKVRILKITD